MLISLISNTHIKILARRVRNPGRKTRIPPSATLVNRPAPSSMRNISKKKKKKDRAAQRKILHLDAGFYMHACRHAHSRTHALAHTHKQEV